MLRQQYKSIKILFYDFDGVMTDNTFILDSNGHESVRLNRSDGLAIKLFKNEKIDQIIISSEKNKIVKTRAKKLNIKCYSGIENKFSFLKKYMKINNIKPINCCYIGNDLNDLDSMSMCRFRFCPVDSHKKIKLISNKMLKSKGGEGVISELYDLIIK